VSCANNIPFVNFLAVLVLESRVLHQFDVLRLKRTVDADPERHPMELDNPTTGPDQIFRVMSSPMAVDPSKVTSVMAQLWSL